MGAIHGRSGFTVLAAGDERRMFDTVSVCIGCLVAAASLAGIGGLGGVTQWLAERRRQRVMRTILEADDDPLAPAMPRDDTFPTDPSRVQAPHDTAP